MIANNNEKYDKQCEIKNYLHNMESNKQVLHKQVMRAELRENFKRKYQVMFRGSSHLLYVLAFTIMKDFH